MIKPENKILLEGLKTTGYGRALQEFLDEKKNELNDVSTCKSWDETLGRAKAVAIIDEIFSFMKDKVEVSNKTRYD